MICTVVGVVAVGVVWLLLLLVPQPITGSHVAPQQRNYPGSQRQYRSTTFRSRTVVTCLASLQSNEFFVTTGRDIPRGGNIDAEKDDRRNQSTVKDDEVNSTVLPSSVTNNVIRIRMLDGTIQKVSVSEWTTLSVVEAIRQSVAVAQRGRTSAVGSSYHITLPNGSAVTGHADHSHENDNAADRNNNNDNDILSKSLNDLGVKHGSLVTIHSNGPDVTSAKAQSRSTTFTSKWKTRHHHQQRRFDPFPELAKDYDAAVRQAKIKRNGASSYSTIAALQASLHTVEPQSIGTIQRIYMCHVAAAKFQARGMDTSDRHHGGIALLLGTITTERKDLHQPKKARTSLSSTVEGDQYCCAARVHAIWEPPLLKKVRDPLDGTKLLLPHLSATDTTNVIRVAQYLGLQPIGWMFSYSNDRTTSHLDSNLNEGGLPVWGREIEIGARLQMEHMKKYCRENDSERTSTDRMIPRFGTLAMDARSGATEAFQLSDVAVQMVAEDMLVLGENLGQGNDRSGRYITTRHPVIVDGKETNQLDSVLCLVNVALLSHTGMFTSSATTLSSKKQRDGKISNKTRKAILKAIDEADNDTHESNGANSEIFGIINDFNILLAIDEILTEEDSKQLCAALYKWARGQKKSVKLDSQLTKRLQRALDATM